MSRFAAAFLFALAASVTARAGTPAERIAVMEPGDAPAAQRFQMAYQVLLRADDARDRGRAAEAAKFYRQALDVYVGLAQKYPDWQPGVTRFRIGYCDSQLEALLRDGGGEPAPRASPPAGTSEGPDPGSTLAPPRPRGATPPDPAAARKIADRARGLLADGSLDEARVALIEGLRIAPDDAQIRLLVGTLHCVAGEYEKAMFILESLVEEQETNAVARVVLGAAYFGLGRAQNARDEVEKAVMIATNLPEAHYNLAQMLAAGDPPQKDGARLHYLRAVELGAKPDGDFERRIEGPASEPAPPVAAPSGAGTNASADSAAAPGT
jgi:tetratricopeptide (TPR) repeat protein